MEKIIPSEREERIRKLDEIRSQGINPYPASSKRNISISKILENFSEAEKNCIINIMAGRLRIKREHGNLCFAQVQDDTGTIQVAFSKKDIGADKFKFFNKLIDIGDFIEVTGTCFVTHKGEQSIMASDYTLLSKALRPLPEKWHGLTDDDKRQRFRELEMISDTEVVNKFNRRSAVIKTIREFMWSNGFSEVETPVLQNVYGGTYAKPFTTHYNVLDFDLYLRIAPEIFLKRSIVGGFEKIFEIGKCFRNEGMDSDHLQEFTMFEFYWPYNDYQQLMEFTEKLFTVVIETVYDGNFKIMHKDATIDFKPPYKRIKFADLIEQYLKVKLSDLDTTDKITKYISENNLLGIVNMENKLGWSAQLDELYKKTVRKKIIEPIFVTDYPKEFMALAKANADNPEKVSTFQLVVNGCELLKAYNELNDPIDQKERFEKQERLIMEGDEEAMPYDHDFVESMEYGLPPVAGWGMGIDRFFALLEGEDNLRDTIIFPTMKPKIK